MMRALIAGFLILLFLTGYTYVLYLGYIGVDSFVIKTWSHFVLGGFSLSMIYLSNNENSDMTRQFIGLGWLCLLIVYLVIIINQFGLIIEPRSKMFYFSIWSFMAISMLIYLYSKHGFFKK